MTIQKQVNELTSLSSFADSNVIPVHDGNGLKKGTVTQLTTNLATKFSNENLLINPDFRVNQGGGTNYMGNSSTKTYTIDRWYIFGENADVTVNDDGSIFVRNAGSSEATFAQISENTYSNVTASAKVIGYNGIVKLFTDNATKQVTANTIISMHDSGSVTTCGFKLSAGAGVTLKWIKLENGTTPTSFVASNFDEEYSRCQWYKSTITGVRYGYWSSGKLYLGVPECASMRTSKPTPKSIAFEGWLYVDGVNVFTITSSSFTSIAIDGYKEIVATPSTTFAKNMAGYSYKVIAFVFNAGKGLQLDGEIY